MTGTDSYMLVAFKGLLNGPAKKINSGRYCVSGHSSVVAPLRQRQGNAAASYVAIVRSVILLLFHCRPTAVFRRVAKMVFNPVYRMFWGRALPHIFEKRAVVFPARADRYSFVFWYLVPLRYSNPNPIRSGFPAALAVSVYCALDVPRHNLFSVIPRRFKALSVHIFHQAATRAGVAKNKAVGWGYEYSAAIASAFPRTVMMRVHPQAANGCQAGEFLSCQIFRSSHVWY